jgi:hypothetical protein
VITPTLRDQTIDHLIVELCQLVYIRCKCLQSFSFCIVVDRRATRGNERVWAKYRSYTAPIRQAKPETTQTPAAQRQVGTAGVLRGSERTDPRWPYLDWICLAISITYPEPCRGNQAAATRLHILLHRCRSVNTLKKRKNARVTSIWEVRFGKS